MRNFPEKKALKCLLPADEAEAMLVRADELFAETKDSISAFIAHLLKIRDTNAYVHWSHKSFAAYVVDHLKWSYSWVQRHIAVNSTLALVDRKLQQKLESLPQSGPISTKMCTNYLSSHVKRPSFSKVEAAAKVHWSKRDAAVAAIVDDCASMSATETETYLSEKFPSPVPIQVKQPARQKFDHVDVAEFYRSTMLEISKQLAAQAELGDAAIGENGANVIAATIQTLRILRKKIRGWEPRKDCPF